MYSLPTMSVHSVLSLKPKELTFELLKEKFSSIQSKITENSFVKYVDLSTTTNLDIISSDGESIGSVGRITVSYKDGLGSFIIYIWNHGGIHKWSWLCHCSETEEKYIYEWLHDIQNA